jgi:aryl-alcohol dehydrogenase
MTRTITAAVCRTPDGPIALEDATIDDPRPGEVLVRIVGVGVCHTDMVMRSQQLPVPQPSVLGHEGSGIVERIGEDVTGLAIGDPVVLSFNSCGVCPNCADHAPAYCHQFGLYNFAGIRPDGSTTLSGSGGAIHGNIFGQSSFATYALASARNTVRVPDDARDVPLELLGPLGCGIQTGAGAVLNSMEVKPGSSIAIFGSGAVGLSAVMASRIAGATTIIAVDLNPARLTLALELGATHALAGGGDVYERIAALCPAGLNYAFDTTGIAAIIEGAFNLIAPRGVLGLVGASDFDATLTFNEAALMGGGKTVKGILEGDSDPHVFIPELIAHHRAGRFPFDRLVEYFPFDAIEAAFHAGESGSVIKPILRMPV